MSATTIRTTTVFLLLVAIGVAGRFVFETPNLTPTVAVALFAGFYFRRMLVAAAVPVAILAISNLWLESHGSRGVMVTTYLAFCFPILLRGLFRKQGQTHFRTACRVATGVLAPSLVFYLSTNLAVWVFGTIYAPTAEGLATCYVYAIPFYQFFLQGDLLFIPMMFAAYAAVKYLASEPSESLAAVLAPAVR